MVALRLPAPLVWVPAIPPLRVLPSLLAPLGLASAVSLLWVLQALPLLRLLARLRLSASLAPLVKASRPEQTSLGRPTNACCFRRVFSKNREGHFMGTLLSRFNAARG